MRKLHQTIRKVGDDIPRAQLQHGDRGDDGVHERRCAQASARRTATRSSRWCSSSRRSRRTSPRSCGSGSATRGACSTRGGRRSTRRWRARTTIELAVQVNGKMRGTISVPRDIAQDEAVAAAMAEPSIAKFVTGDAEEGDVRAGPPAEPRGVGNGVRPF